MQFGWRVSRAPPLTPRCSGPAHTTTGASLMLSSSLYRVGSIDRREECTPSKRGAQLMSFGAGALFSWPRLPSRSRLEPLFDRPGFSARSNRAFSREPLVMMSTSNCGRFLSQLSSWLEPKTFRNLTWSGRRTNCHVPLFKCLAMPCNPLFRETWRPAGRLY